MGFDLFSPGCNCKLIFTPNSACDGTFTWCTKPNIRVVLQKQINGNWTNVQVFLPSDPQSYTINNLSQQGNYRIQCELCSDKWATSDPVQTDLCGYHSAWARLFKKDRTLTSWYPRGAYLAGSPLSVHDIWRETFGDIEPLVPYFPGIYYKYPETFPSPYGCSSDLLTYRSGTVKIFSRNEVFTATRTGYTFDYRLLHLLQAPQCNTNFSINEIFPNRGLISLGSTTHRFDWDIDYTELGTFTVEYQSGSFFNQSTITPSSGENYNYNAFFTRSADIELWLPPLAGPFLWPDGSTTPTLGFNSSGLVQKNKTSNQGESGTKRPMMSCENQYSFYPDLSLMKPFTKDRVLINAGFQERILRSCTEYFNGTNPLPPGTVLEDDPCLPVDDSGSGALTCFP